LKIQLLSDLHLEYASFKPSQIGADIIVLAGDIAVGAEGVLWAKQAFDMPVIYVTGNHEFHDAAFTMGEHMAMMKQVADGSNVTVLDNESVEFSGVRFVGSTMWSDVEKAYSVLFCDIDRISVDENSYGPVHFSKEYQQNLFENNRNWLKSELEKPFVGKTVVVTHHAPSWKSLHEQHAGSPWNPCFMTDLEEVMSGVDVWMHGHTHNSFDYSLDRTRVVCNPRGYPNDIIGFENSEFDAGKIVEV